MTSGPHPNWAEIEAIFADAVALDAQGRAAMLDSRCTGRLDVRREVESLLASHDLAGDFLQARTVAGGTNIFDPASSVEKGDP